MTPGSHTPSPYTPTTPGAGTGLADTLGSSDWYSPDIEVIIRDSHEDSGLCGQVGVVRGVTPGKLIDGCAINFRHRLGHYIQSFYCLFYKYV